MNFSLINVSKNNGELIDGCWMQDCSGTTLEEATKRARETEAVNTGHEQGGKIDVAVVESVSAGGPDYSIKKDLRRLDVIILEFVGTDSSNRPVYVDKNKRFWKDTDPRQHRAPNLCTAYLNEFDGETDVPMSVIKQYNNIKVKFIPNRILW